jgi:hypothetical protein
MEGEKVPLSNKWREEIHSSSRTVPASQITNGVMVLFLHFVFECWIWQFVFLIQTFRSGTKLHIWFGLHYVEFGQCDMCTERNTHRWTLPFCRQACMACKPVPNSALKSVNFIHTALRLSLFNIFTWDIPLWYSHCKVRYKDRQSELQFDSILLYNLLQHVSAFIENHHQAM